MAQVDERRASMIGRIRLLASQRPVLMPAIALAVGLMVGAGVFGAAWAADTMGARQWGETDIEVVRDRQASGRDADVLGRGDASERDREDEPVHDRAEDTDERAPVVVDVAGAVVAPGVYQLTKGARVEDALKAAGGIVEGADLAMINRAALLSDGQRVYIPREGEQTMLQQSPDLVGEGSTNMDASTEPRLVNINSATVAELDELPGVGPSTAQAIVEDREAHGPFASPEDLMRVSGIGEKKFEKLKSGICV